MMLVAQQENSLSNTISPVVSVPVDNRIDNSMNLDDEQKNQLWIYINNNVSSDEEKVKFITQFLSLSHEKQKIVADYIKNNKPLDVDYSIIIAVIDVFSQDIATDALQGTLSERQLSLLVSLEHDSQGAASEFINFISNNSLAQDELNTIVSYFSDLVVVISGETVVPDSRNEILNLYASSVTPFKLLLQDLLNLNKLKSAYSGSGEFTLDDLMTWDLSSVTNSAAESDVSSVISVLQDFSVDNDAISSVSIIREFIDSYRLGGGLDPAAALRSLGTINDGLVEIKEQLGLKPNAVLPDDFKSYLIEALASGVSNNDLEGAIDDEIRKIKSAYTTPENKTLDFIAYQFYVESGYQHPVSNHPLSVINFAQPTALVQRERSAFNSESTVLDYEFISLDQYGFSDILESPLYDDNILRTQFNGNVQEYAIYLAQAHGLLENLGITPDMYDGVGSDQLTLNQVKFYVHYVGYNADEISQEIHYILDIKKSFVQINDEQNLADTQSVGSKIFNAIDYIKSDGAVYMIDGAPFDRPRGTRDTYTSEHIPASIFYQTSLSFNGHTASARLSTAELSFKRKESQASDNIVAGVTKIFARAGSDHSKEAEYEFGEKDQLENDYSERIRFKLMADFVKTENSEKNSEGEPLYFTSDGSLKNVYTTQGVPIYMNGSDEILTEIELDAILKFATPEMLKSFFTYDVIESLGLEDRLKSADLTNDDLLGSMTDPNQRSSIRPVEFTSGKTYAQWQAQPFIAENTAIKSEQELVVTRLSADNALLEGHIDFQKKMLDLFVDVGNDIVSIVTNFINALR